MSSCNVAVPIASSLPSREAWIEIRARASDKAAGCSRFPRGKRGLKSIVKVQYAAVVASLPSREAWIEIGMVRTGGTTDAVASLAGSVD